MINLTNLNRQHELIKAEIGFIESAIKKGSSTSINTAEAALHISKLAGLLKIHLIEEDKFLYPDLLDSKDEEIQLIASQYIREMGDLANTYSEYKSSYNVGSKITAKLDIFVQDTKNMMEALKKRIKKEDDELYHLIKIKNM
ncbi:hemerythrin domain-containing protein [Anaerocolumna sedimenticola]|uniref:Hemerythrin domain-containing protein n=1 Tax=Anaerocolumna sedimenticola TaxID=2696063 RepID=A0A6P1TUI7_9FIRM|nr:hemerythrin domain-containing protein [Anaerocolumna sedimenticola]QHQ63095.1 hemerythrin domain-containing protein [Anaerocolumna sedimenticola]